MTIRTLIIFFVLLVFLAGSFPARVSMETAQTAPTLADPSHHLCLGPPRTPRQEKLAALGATSVVFHCGGDQAGIYVDDQVPHQRRVLLELRNYHPGLIFAGIASGSGHPYRLRGVIDDQEFYPYMCVGLPVSAWLPLPRVQAYIVQKYFAFPGCKPPTLAQRHRLWRIVRRYHPKYIWTY